MCIRYDRCMVCGFGILGSVLAHLDLRARSDANLKHFSGGVRVVMGT